MLLHQTLLPLIFCFFWYSLLVHWKNLLFSETEAKREAILVFFDCSEVNGTWLITSELANQGARKVLFTCAVYTNQDISQFKLGNMQSREEFRPMARERKYLLDKTLLGIQARFFLINYLEHWKELHHSPILRIFLNNIFLDEILYILIAFYSIRLLFFIL